VPFCAYACLSCNNTGRRMRKKGGRATLCCFNDDQSRIIAAFFHTHTHQRKSAFLRLCLSYNTMRRTLICSSAHRQFYSYANDDQSRRIATFCHTHTQGKSVFLRLCLSYNTMQRALVCLSTHRQLYSQHLPCVPSFSNIPCLFKFPPNKRLPSRASQDQRTDATG
jgi:hypothetical protein